MSIEILTRLNPKISNMESAGHGTAGGLTASDISAACYKLDRVSDSLLSAHVNGSDGDLKRLLRSTFTMVNNKVVNTGGLFSPIFQQTLKLAADRRWRTVKRGQDRLRILTRVAIHNVVTVPVCKKCNGTKYIDNLKCKGCGGSGHKRFDARAVAKELGIAESTYSEHYQYKYNDIVCMIQDIMHRAKVKICL